MKEMIDRVITYYKGKGSIALDFPITKDYTVSMAVPDEALIDYENAWEGDLVVLHNDEDITSKLFDTDSQDIRVTTDNLVKVIRLMDKYVEAREEENDIS